MDKIVAVIPVVNSFYIDRCVASMVEEVDKIFLIHCRHFKYPEWMKRYLNQLGSKINYIECEQNKILTAYEGYEKAFKQIGTNWDYLIMANQDTQVIKTCIPNMIECFKNDDKLGLLGPIELNVTTDNDSVIKEATKVLDFNRVCKDDEYWNWWIDYQPSANQYDYVDGIGGFLMMINRECFIKCQPLSQGLKTQCEDADISLDVYQGGWKIAVSNKSKCYHIRHSSSEEIEESCNIVDNLLDFKNRLINKTNKNNIQIIEKDCKIKNKKDLHIIGLPYVNDYTENFQSSFSLLIGQWTKMIYDLDKFNIIFYGPYNTGISYNEYVNVPTKDYQENLQIAMYNRVVGSKGYAVSFSGERYDFLHSPENIFVTIDPLVGHQFLQTMYRVYPTKSWMSFIYGTKANWSGTTFVHSCDYWGDAVIYHYLDIEKYGNYFNGEKRDNYAVFAGRVNYDKGIEQAIIACRNTNMTLHVVGNVPEQNKHLLENNRDIVEYHGFVSKHKLFNILSNAKCTFCFTHYMEPFNCVAIESMLCGTPVISSNWGSFSEINVHGKTGFRCTHYGDIEYAIKNIDKISPFNCKKWIMENFSMDVAKPIYSQYLDKVMEMDRCSWYDVRCNDNLLFTDLKAPIWYDN